MSAAAVILPQVWGMTCTASSGAPLGRKRPYGLSLVAAEAPSRPRATRALPAPEFAFYRKHTEAMLQRYMKLSLEGGRVPSLLGRELFRGNVSHYEVQGFDDVVIFVHDVESCMKALSPGQQHLVRRIALQEHSQGETAAILGINLRTVIRRYYEALDRLTGMLIERRMLQPLVEARARQQKLEGA
jgi:predicted DNA-binding protein (UPF0251 family)